MNKIKHLEMIQLIINRMASNSFLVKAWCVTLVAAILTLSAKDSDKRFIAVAYYPVLMFWILDGYFLHQERLFRKLYDFVLTQPEESVNFSMDTKSFREKVTWTAATFSKTLLLFYITMVLAILLTLLFVFDII
jgi:hypothetical protein